SGQAGPARILVGSPHPRATPKPQAGGLYLCSRPMDGFPLINPYEKLNNSLRTSEASLGLISQCPGTGQLDVEEDTMQPELAAKAVTTVGVVLFMFAALPAQAAQCSLQKVAGSYGYTTNGFVAASPTTFVPVAAAGTITFDGQGNVSGTQTRVVAGSALDET